MTAPNGGTIGGENGGRGGARRDALRRLKERVVLTNKNYLELLH